jgi:hypothetical protein
MPLPPPANRGPLTTTTSSALFCSVDFLLHSNQVDSGSDDRVFHHPPQCTHPLCRPHFRDRCRRPLLSITFGFIFHVRTYRARPTATATSPPSPSVVCTHTPGTTLASLPLLPCPCRRFMPPCTCTELSHRRAGEASAFGAGHSAHAEHGVPIPTDLSQSPLTHGSPTGVSRTIADVGRVLRRAPPTRK